MTTDNTDCPDCDSSDLDWLIDPDGPCDPSDLVTLPGVVTSRDGVMAEHDWTDEHFPGFSWKRQRTRQNKHGQQVDEVTLSGPDGSEVKVYFDITDWFGKPETLSSRIKAVHKQLEKDVKAGDPKAKAFKKLRNAFRPRD